MTIRHVNGSGKAAGIRTGYVVVGRDAEAAALQAFLGVEDLDAEVRFVITGSERGEGCAFADLDAIEGALVDLAEICQSVVICAGEEDGALAVKAAAHFSGLADGLALIDPMMTAVDGSAGRAAQLPVFSGGLAALAFAVAAIAAGQTMTGRAAMQTLCSQMRSVRLPTLIIAGPDASRRARNQMALIQENIAGLVETALASPTAGEVDEGREAEDALGRSRGRILMDFAGRVALRKRKALLRATGRPVTAEILASAA